MNGSLQKIVKGSAIAFVGMFAFGFFEFISRVIITRYTTQSEYGSYSIGLALLYISLSLSCLGLSGGVIRCIAYFRGKGENEKVAGVIYSSLKLSIGTSLFLFIFIFFSADILADALHLQPIIIKLFALALPFFVVVEMLSCIFIGFGKVDKRVYFRDILMSLLKVSGILVAGILALGFIGIMYAFLLSFVVAAIIFTVYAFKKLSIGNLKENALIRKRLFYFSIPILISNLTQPVILRTDTLLLGYFKTPDIVGLYNTASPIIQLFSTILISISFIYVPTSSQLYSKNLVGELKRNYAILTKWSLSITLPFFFIIFLFPEAILTIIFGSSYIAASKTMQILALGVLISILVGPNAATLVVIGKTKLNMVDDLIGAILNVSLNLFLIPTMGIIGAAIASLVSLSIIAILKSAQLYSVYKLHPFTKNYLKLIGVSTAIVFFIYLVASPVSSIWMIILLFFLFIVVFGITLVITKSLDEEDKNILLLTLKKLVRA